MKYILLVILLFSFTQSYSQSNSSKDLKGTSIQYVYLSDNAALPCTQADAKCEEKGTTISPVKTLHAGMQLPTSIDNIKNITWAGWLWIVFRIGVGLVVFFGLYIYFTKRRSRITKRISARWVKLLNVHSKAN